MASTIALFTLTSSLHNAAELQANDMEFLNGIEQQGISFENLADNYALLSQHRQKVLYVRTGGTESIFKEIFPILDDDVLLLTSGRNNSLAASMEILSFLNQQGRRGEILHGSASHIAQRLHAHFEKPLQGHRAGVIGKPSDWLIASNPDVQALHQKLGMELEDIPIAHLIDKVVKLRAVGRHFPQLHEVPHTFIPVYQDALVIYTAIKEIIDEYRLSAVTLRCFDLLGAIGNTGCLALAMLNAEGIPASCEGDIPALVSMMLAQRIVGQTGFQANPAALHLDSGEMLFVHCTAPFNMLKSYGFDTHFESGIGIAIAGDLPEGPVTLFKVSGDLTRHFLAEGTLLRNQHQPNLCRTQVVIKPDDPTVITEYFLRQPIGNHHIIITGHHQKTLEEHLQKQL